MEMMVRDKEPIIGQLDFKHMDSKEHEILGMEFLPCLTTKGVLLSGGKVGFLSTPGGSQ